MADDIDFTADVEESPESSIDFTADPTPAVAQAPRPIIPPSQDWGANAYIPQTRVVAPQFWQDEYRGAPSSEQIASATAMSPYGLHVTGKGQEEVRIPFDPSKAMVPLSKLALTPEGVQAGKEALFSKFLNERDRRSLMEAPLVADPESKAIAGLTQGVARTAESLTSPMNIGLMVGTAGMSAVPAAARLTSGAFAADMARQVPEMARNLGEAVASKDPEAITRAATELAATGAFTAAAGTHAVGPRARVTLPETMRELAKEPSTTGAPNAVREQEAATSVRGLPEQPSVNEQLPAKEGGGGVPPSGVPPGDAQGAPRAEEAKPAEVPLKEEPSPLPKQFHDKPVAETTDLVKGVTSEELAAYKGKAGAGATGFMWDLGAKAKTVEDVSALRKIGEDASAETKALMKAGDAMGAMKIIGRQPAEAYEYATGVKLDGTPKWEVLEKMAAMKGQTYKPPVPDPQYLKAKGETDAAPETAKSAPAEINLKDRPVTEAEKANEMYMESNWTHVEDVTDAQGNTVGKIRGNATPGLFQVKGANIVKSQQGKGTYQKVIRQLAEKYGTVQSDTDMQPAAEAAWQKVGGQRQSDGSYKLSRSAPTAPAPRGIAASARVPGALKGGEAGSVPLAPLEPVAKAAVEFVKGVPTTMKVVGAQLAGKSAPKTSTASVESGNALVRYASSKIAAPLVAESMATDVLGTRYKDAKFGEKLGALLVEDRLRAIKDAFTKAGDTKAARKVNSLIGKQDSPFKTEADFQTALTDPEIRAAIDRHKTTVQPTAEAAHEEAGGTLAGSGLNTGAFVNLKAIFEGGEENLLRGGGRGNLMNPLRRPSRFSKTAAGTAEKYETDYRTISQRMIEGNYEESTKRQMYDQLVKDGLAVMNNPGDPAPEIGGKPAVKFTIERKGVPAGENKVRTYVKNLWVRSDLAGEVRQALNVDGPVQRSGIVNAATLLNRIQLAGPTDAVWHTANMLGSIAGSQGGKNVLVDMARKIPGVNLPDAIGRVVASSIKVLAKTPEVQRQIAELADIGAMRAKGVAKEGRLAKIANFNHNVISMVDKAGRLVRDDMYKNLVSRGLVEDTPANRREWVNQMGQYNGRLMGQFQRFFKDAGFSPFVVAGRNFNRMAMRRITMDPGIKAISPKAAVEMRSIEAFGTIATLFAIPALANYLLTGSPGGRPGTKMGQIDTGKDDQGKHVVIDPAQWTGHRRGLRISGLQAVIEGAQRGETRGRIAGNVIRDVMGGVIHPWAGPAVGAASVGYTGYSPVGYKESENPKDYGANITAALKQLNPTAGTFLKGDAKGTGGLKGAGLSLAGAVGVKEVKPFTSYNKMGVLHQSWMANNTDPKVKADYEQMQTATFPTSKYKSLDDALAQKDEAGAIKAIGELKAEGQKNKDILRRMRPFVGEGINSRTKPLFHESHKLEAAFRNSLNSEQRAEYQKALAERKATYQEFLKVWRKRDSTTTGQKIDFVPDAGQ